MADITVTAANVGLTANTGSSIRQVQFGEAVTQGQPVYLNTSDGKYYKTDANVSATTAGAAGIVLTPAATDEYGVIATAGPIDLGASLTVATTYIVSATAGGIAPVADLASGWYSTILGTALTAGILQLDINASGIAKA